MAAIFISHSSEDAVVARRLRERLIERGYRSIFLDVDARDGIAPGQRWEKVLYRSVRSCRAVVALVSRHSLASEWCRIEIAHARALDAKIFPVRLDDSELGPLGELQVVDLQGPATDDPDAYRPLLDAIEGAKIPKGGWDPDRPPYPGLQSFKEEDAAVFFGRDAATDGVMRRLDDATDRPSSGWLVLLGASGSGKSSLLRAGVLPRLRVDDRWFVVGPFTRGHIPLESLAIALESTCRACGLSRSRRELRDDLSPAGMNRLAIELRLAAGRAGAKLLIVLDQFEELFPEVADQAAADCLELLAAVTAGETAPCFVVATLRADFLGAFQNHPALRTIASEEFVVKAVDTTQLARIIVEPATLAGVTFEEGLVAELISDTAGGDALPLLAFVLRELHEKCGDDGVIESVEYHAHLGGLHQAIARKADQLLADESVPGGDPAIRRLFLSMVQVREDNVPMRRRVRWSDVPPQLHATLKRFVKARLLVSAAEEGGDDQYVEVAHEALFRSWSRLERWIKDSQEFLSWRKRLDPLVRKWEARPHDSERLLRRPELGEAESWLEKEAALLSDSESGFIGASLGRERRHRVARRFALGAAFAIVTALGGAAIVQAQRARSAAAQSQNFAVFAAGSHAADPTERLALLREVRSPAPPGWASAASAVLWSPVADAILEHGGPVTSVTVSRDGQRIVTGSRDGVARVWRVDGVGAPIELSGHTSVDGARFSPDGTLVLTVSIIDGSARVWRADGSGVTRVLSAGKVVSAAFAPDGAQVLTGSGDGVGRLWTLADGRVRELVGCRTPIMSVAFAPDGKSALGVCTDATVRVWRLDHPEAPLVLSGHTKYVTRAVFSPDGARILTASRDGTARLWSLDGTGTSVELKGHTDEVLAAEYGPSGRGVLTGSEDGTARLWLVGQTEEALILKGHAGAVNAVAISPQGNRFLTGSADATARLWDRGIEVELKGHSDEVTSVAFAASSLVTGSADKTARVWNVTVPAVGRQVDPAFVAAFSPDGRKLLTSTIHEPTAHLWDPVGTGDPIPLTVAAEIRAIAFSGDGSAVAIATATSSWISRLDVTDSRVELGDWSRSAMMVALNRDGRRVAVSTARGVFVSNVGGSPLRLKQDTIVTALAISPDGRRVVTGSGMGGVKVWDAEDSASPTALRIESPTMIIVSSVAFSSDGRRIVAASQDGVTRVFSLEHPDRIVEFPSQHGPPTVTTFSPDGKRVATGFANGHAVLWNADDPVRPFEIHGHTERLIALSFSPDGKRVLSCSADGVVRDREWDPDVRPLLWRQSHYCLPAARRETLLGELPPLARDGERRCHDLVERCRASADTCRNALAAALGP
jgi:WD40 repeat protein